MPCGRLDAEYADRPHIHLGFSRTWLRIQLLSAPANSRPLAYALPHLNPLGKEALMSQQMVGVVVDKLVNDEELRSRFVVDRLETLAELCLGGVELRPDEIDLFYRTDARLWFLGAAVAGTTQH
jgi:hypothetical protein